jgi:hypothetical protein
MKAWGILQRNNSLGDEIAIMPENRAVTVCNVGTRATKFEENPALSSAKAVRHESRYVSMPAQFCGKLSACFTVQAHNSLLLRCKRR